jgi:hypothetical protein
MKTRTVESREEYVQLRNKCEDVNRNSKQQVWQKIGKDLQQELEGSRKLLYSMAKNYRSER